MRKKKHGYKPLTIFGKKLYRRSSTQFYTLFIFPRKQSSWWSLEEVFSVNFFCLSRRLQDIIAKRLEEDVLQTRLEDVLKTSCKDVLQIRLEDDLKTSWRRLKDVLENKKCLLDYWYQIYILVYWYHQFKGSSELNSNKIILQLSWNNINFSKFIYSCFEIILVNYCWFDYIFFYVFTANLLLLILFSQKAPS